MEVDGFYVVVVQEVDLVGEDCLIPLMSTWFLFVNRERG